MLRSLDFIFTDIGICTAFKELSNLYMSPFQCLVQRSLVIVVPCIYVCTTIDEELSKFQVSFLGREVQYSLVVLVRCIYICPTVEKNLYNFRAL